jgi:hypothetical protein
MASKEINSGAVNQWLNNRLWSFFSVGASSQQSSMSIGAELQKSSNAIPPGLQNHLTSRVSLNHLIFGQSPLH